MSAKSVTPFPSTATGVGTNPTLTPTDSLSIAEFAAIFGFTPAALIDAIHRNRQAIRKQFYSISELADRWGCSRGTVYAVLRESELKILNVAPTTSVKRDKWKIPASVVEHIERMRSQAMPEAA